MTSERVQPTTPTEPLPHSVRAQILATEHWSLLATRGTTWSEVMSRITIHLTVSSAALVVLALVVNANGFGTAFHVMSVGLAAAVLLLGTLTWVRVHNASADDAAMITGMNRLRAAYVEMDPSLAQYLVTAWYDDMAGLSRTYAMGTRRGTVSHVVGSTAFFLVAVNSIVAGTLAALVADTAGASVAVVAVAGVLAFLAYLVVALELGRRSFGSGPDDVRFPAPQEAAGQR